MKRMPTSREAAAPREAVALLPRRVRGDRCTIQGVQRPGGDCLRAGKDERLARHQARAAEDLRSALQHRRSRREGEAPDQLHRLGASARGVRSARCSLADRSRVGVRGARTGRSRLSVGRRAAERAAPQRLRRRVRRLDEEPPRSRRARRPRCTTTTTAFRTRRRSEAFRRASRGTGSKTSSATSGSGSPIGTRRTTRRRRRPRRSTRKARRPGTERVIRGGAWNGAEPSWVRPTFRFPSAADVRGTTDSAFAARSRL